MKKIDLHIHTNASHDGYNSLEEIIEKSAEMGLTSIAITDHDVIHSDLLGKRIRKIKNIEVITGIEVSTDQGHVIGLFLEEKIKSTSFKKTLIEIKNKKGLTYIPHPNRASNGVSIQTIKDNINLIDIIEYQNTYSLNKDMKEIKKQFQSETNLFASTDSHKIDMIGSVMTEINNPENVNIRNLLSNKFELKIVGDPYYINLPLSFKGKILNWLKIHIPVKNTNFIYNGLKKTLIRLKIIDKRFFRNVH